MARVWLLAMALLPSCLYPDDDAYSGGPSGPSYNCSTFAIDNPTKDSTWTTREQKLDFSGAGGTEPLVWTNQTSGATGNGSVYEGLGYDPIFCPQGCPVRRFGGSVPLVAGFNMVTVSDAHDCSDSIVVDYVPYPTDCTATPTLTITMPSSEPSVMVTSGTEVTVGGDSTGELEHFSWYAGGFSYGDGPFTAGLWEIPLGVTYQNTTFTMTVRDRCGITAHDEIELVVPVPRT